MIKRWFLSCSAHFLLHLYFRNPPSCELIFGFSLQPSLLTDCFSFRSFPQSYITCFALLLSVRLSLALCSTSAWLVTLCLFVFLTLEWILDLEVGFVGLDTFITFIWNLVRDWKNYVSWIMFLELYCVRTLFSLLVYSILSCYLLLSYSGTRPTCTLSWSNLHTIVSTNHCNFLAVTLYLPLLSS